MAYDLAGMPGQQLEVTIKDLCDQLSRCLTEQKSRRTPRDYLNQISSPLVVETSIRQDRLDSQWKIIKDEQERIEKLEKLILAMTKKPRKRGRARGK